jgi:putative ABC transport system substrate-binding protein
MKKPTLIVTLALALLAAPLAAGAQTAGKVYRIGFLRAGEPPKTFVDAFLDGLRERGYVGGQDVVVEFRLTDGSIEQIPQLAEELVSVVEGRRHPCFRRATGSRRKEGDHVGAYRLCGRDRPGRAWTRPESWTPGGNMTGLANNSADLPGKRLELLRELVPKLRRVAVLSHPGNPANSIQLKEAEGAARALGIQLEPVPVRGPNDFDPASRAVHRAHALLQLDSPLVTTHRVRLAECAAKRRLPAIYTLRDYADVGGLMSYGPHHPDQYRRAATYVDKILKGTKPADLPVEQPTRFELSSI